MPLVSDHRLSYSRYGIICVSPILLGWLFVTAEAQAGDIAAGREKAKVCVACHGRFGKSAMPFAPNIAGQPAVYLEEQLRAYRSKKRQHEVMNVAAQDLSDEEIENLAAWYASIEIEIKPPE